MVRLKAQELAADVRKQARATDVELTPEQALTERMEDMIEHLAVEIDKNLAVLDAENQQPPNELTPGVIGVGK